jgi:menaquinone-specific isochorismate synthase
MPITPPDINLLPNRQELYNFLADCYDGLNDHKKTKIVSISFPIDTVDPLTVLQTLSPSELHFYMQKGKIAIAAIDTVMKLTVNGSDRFQQVQNFITNCLENTITEGDRNFPLTGIHFFCSFSFFPHSNSVFPPATVFIPRWQISSYQEQSFITANILLNRQDKLENIFDNLWYNLSLIYSSITNHNSLNLPKIPHAKQLKLTFNKLDFKNSVTAAIKSINHHQFDKIVLSQAVDVLAGQNFNLVHSLDNLRRNYPDCYVFSVSNGQGKTFIGASPERLINIHNHHLETDALAGSAPRGKTPQEDHYLGNLLLNSDKERHEHQVVIKFILEKLANLGIKPQKTALPTLLKLSNIQHLWTPIKAQVPSGIHPLKIIAQLHPTPAVAGVPRDITCAKILEYENFDRSVYAAPLGWIDHRGNSEFIVGIRSAIIDSNTARLFAGAGIVSGSNPDKELAEIEMKLQVLLNNLV